jgi:hypothetical protein
LERISAKPAFALYAGILALLGGAFLVAFGLMSIYPSAYLNYFTFTVPVLGSQNLFLGGVATVALGILAIVSARWATKPVLGLLLLAVSIVAGGVGGALVFLSAVFGLVSKPIKLQPK